MKFFEPSLRHLLSEGKIKENRGLGGGVGSLLSHPSKHYVHGGLGNVLKSVIFPDVLFVFELRNWDSGMNLCDIEIF